MTNKILKAIELKNQGQPQYFETEFISEAEIREYTDIVLKTVLNMKFKSADMKANVEKLKETGLDLNFIDSKRVLGTAYCLRSEETFGRFELNRDYTKVYSNLDFNLEVANTIVHEIGHFVAGSEHAHDGTWQNTCSRIAKELAKTDKYIKASYYCFYASCNSNLPSELNYYITAESGYIEFVGTSYSREKITETNEVYGYCICEEDNLLAFISEADPFTAINKTVETCCQLYTEIFGERGDF